MHAGRITWGLKWALNGMELGADRLQVVSEDCRFPGVRRTWALSHLKRFGDGGSVGAKVGKYGEYRNKNEILIRSEGYRDRI